MKIQIHWMKNGWEIMFLDLDGRIQNVIKTKSASKAVYHMMRGHVVTHTGCNNKLGRYDH